MDRVRKGWEKRGRTDSHVVTRYTPLWGPGSDSPYTSTWSWKHRLGSGALTGHVSKEFALAGPATYCASTISGTHPGESSCVTEGLCSPTNATDSTAVYFDSSLVHRIWKVGIHALPEQAQGRVISLPPGSKNCCRGTGGSTYQGFFSSRRSGTTFTKAMYRNPPEVKGRIQATVSPAQIQKALVITETEPWETTQKGKKTHKYNKHCLPPISTEIPTNLTYSFWWLSTYCKAGS